MNDRLFINEKLPTRETLSFRARKYEAAARAHFSEGRAPKDYRPLNAQKRGERRTRRVVEKRTFLSDSRLGRPARNIKVSNYNARHDTSFRPSSIKSHETPGGHRYRVICTPMLSGGDARGSTASLLTLLPRVSSRHCTVLNPVGQRCA